VSRSGLHPVKAVLFDWGHTLFDTAGSIDFIVSWSADHGSPVSADDARRLHADALTRARTAEELAKGRDKSLAIHRECWVALWRPLEAVCPGLPEALWKFETTAAGWSPFIDAIEVLTALGDAGIRVAVVSDVPFDLRPIFDHYGIRHLVEAFILSGEHGVLKAERELFRIALRALHLNPVDVLMVGDNNANDGFGVTEGIRTLLLPAVPSGTPRGLDAVLRLVGI
jgi:HAD superfamily hydrolase (TIGR01549 family)